jgi:hypothetical protein
MSDGLTPRVRCAIFRVTGQVPTGNETVAAGVACQLERELQDANRRVEELEEYARKLEEAGNRMYVLLDPASICMRTTEMDNALQGWDDAKIGGKEIKP